jgi:long-chain acyl-CoA synthetase
MSIIRKNIKTHVTGQVFTLYSTFLPQKKPKITFLAILPHNFARIPKPGYFCLVFILKIMEYFIRTFENSVRRCWDRPALDEFHSSSLTYGELAAEIESIRLYWVASGLKPGDKIAINARSSANWAKIFLTATSGGFVAVQLFNGYTPEGTQQLVNHSDSRILYTEKAIFEKMDFGEMPQLKGVIDLHSGELLASRGDFEKTYSERNDIFSKTYANGFQKEDLNYPERPMDEVCAINYTSGSTGNPKGVMLTVRNLSANIFLIPRHFPYRKEDNYVSVLPYAHIFGLLYDMLAPLCYGMHLVILFVPPVPANLKPALREFKPYVFFAVPLILNKLIDDSIGEFINSKTGSAKLADYQNNEDFCEALSIIFIKALGGNIGLFVTGGAAIPEPLEQLLTVKLKLPFVTGYGMTECSPTICLGHKDRYKLKSVGEYIDECITAKIDSKDPEHIAGEVLVKGDCVFAGYFKNEEATNAAFTDDGWFHTGDIGTMDKDHTVFLVGRCKNMILTTNGQNIFPEEIEVILNTMKYVAESLIVNRDKKLQALIVPNQNLVADDKVDAETLRGIMLSNIEELNKKIPSFSAISGYELMGEPFAKTPKGSIKRFMYE